MSATKIPLSKILESHPVTGSSASDMMERIKAICRAENWSLAQLVAKLPDTEQAALLSALGDDADDLLYDWSFWGRPNQIPPEAEWYIYAMIMGRGGGKTRSGSEWVNQIANDNPGCRIALVARTSADARDVMVNGDSGICNVSHPDMRPEYFSSKRLLVWPNGSQASTFSSEEPDQLRGPQFHFAWADEAAAWKHTLDDSGLNAWDNLTIATRLGDSPKIFVTTTPKRTSFMYDLMEQEKKWKDGEEDAEPVILVRGSTMDNAGNLSKKYINRMKNLYEGTRLADQELYGLMLDAVDGAMWTDDLLTAGRVNAAPINLPLKVIAVDPSVAEEPNDECGIVVVGSTNHKRLPERHAYVLADESIMGSPSEWAQKVVDVWKREQCPVVVEVNQGGALVANAIHAIDDRVPILEVRATQGKKLRAEPVTLKYDKKHVHHVGVFAELEDQMTTWVPGETKKSPDRVDALVYAVTALLIKPPQKLGSGKIRTARKRMVGRKLNLKSKTGKMMGT